jgi:hypothetical protein
MVLGVRWTLPLSGSHRIEPGQIWWWSSANPTPRFTSSLLAYTPAARSTPLSFTHSLPPPALPHRRLPFPLIAAPVPHHRPHLPPVALPSSLVVASPSVIAPAHPHRPPLPHVAAPTPPNCPPLRPSPHPPLLYIASLRPSLHPPLLYTASLPPPTSTPDLPRPPTRVARARGYFLICTSI